MKKSCSKCGRIKRLSEFAKRADCVDGHLGTCKNCRNEWARKWRQKRQQSNPKLKQKAKKYRHQYYLNHKQQEIITNAKYKQEHREELLDKMKKYRTENQDKCLFIETRSRAKRHNIPFNLEFEDIKIPKFCPVLGIKIKRPKNHNGDTSPSIDRINPKRGYIKGNIIIVSLLANKIKTNATVEQIGKVYKFYKALLAENQSKA